MRTIKRKVNRFVTTQVEEPFYYVKYKSEELEFSNEEEAKLFEDWADKVIVKNTSDLHLIYKELFNIIFGDSADLTYSFGIKRGLDYYMEGMGMEVSALFNSKELQLLGGGVYEGGKGFAIGIDRCIFLIDNLKPR